MEKFKTKKHREFGYKEGIIQGTDKGYAFLLTENKDYFISASDLHGANHKDKALCAITEYGDDTKGEVVKILERGYNEFVGTFEKTKRGGVVVPSEKRYYNKGIVNVRTDAEYGDKVLFKIEGYNRNGMPFGRIAKVLGKEFEKQAEIESILIENDIPLSFSEEVLKESAKCAHEVTSNQLKGRLDLTNKCIITIDGDDAKDFDDAISVERSGDNFILGVHIADVSEYVKEGTLTDKEAYKRGNSYYYPETVIPMLPNVLSDNICSLNENRIRLTLSCIMEFDNKGNRLNYEIKKSYIKSVHRMTYNKVQNIIDGDAVLMESYADILRLITDSYALFKVLQNKKKQNGMIDFGVAECKITVDKNNAITVEKKVQSESEKIIEQFMIAANEAVAHFTRTHKIPSVYRVHENPTKEKVSKLNLFLKEVGIGARLPDKARAKDYSDIIEKIGNGTFADVIKRVMLRSMQKAKYMTEPFGHFGLSLADYCHFTSPIRRYADLTVHRVLKAYISGKDTSKYFNFCEESAWHSTDREKHALDAERAVDDFYKVLYMSNYVGKICDGIVSGVTSFGIFVELENTVEGIIKTENLIGRGYNFDSESLTLSNKIITYKLGMPVKIVVAGVDYGTRRTEFLLYSDDNKKEKLNKKPAKAKSGYKSNKKSKYKKRAKKDYKNKKVW